MNRDDKAKLKECADRLQDSENLRKLMRETADSRINQLEGTLESCESALRSFDVGRESSYWVGEVEKPAPVMTDIAPGYVCPGCGRPYLVPSE